MAAGFPFGYRFLGWIGACVLYVFQLVNHEQVHRRSLPWHLSYILHSKLLLVNLIKVDSWVRAWVEALHFGSVVKHYVRVITFG